MKKLICLLFLISHIAVKAQDLMGFHTSNYAGVYSLAFNPAEIGDSRYKFHMNMIGTNLRFSNDYMWMKSDKFKDMIFSGDGSVFDSETSLKNNTGERLNGNDKEAYFYNKVNGPLSFMLTINSKNAIAISYNLNSLAVVDGVSELLARFAYNNKDPQTYVLSKNNYFNLNMFMWADVGATYSRELMNKGNHNLRGAITVKFNKGLASTYMFGKDVFVKVKNKDSLEYVNANLTGGASEIPYFDNNNSTSPADYLKKFMGNGASGLGMDLGFVYERRDPNANYKYRMDCKDQVRNDMNKYLYKIGVAMTDLGYVTFKRSPFNIHSGFTADSSKAKNIDLDVMSSIKNGVGALQDSLATYNMLLHKASDSFYQILTPTRLNIYVDYKFHKWFYANFTASISPWRRNGNATTHHITEFSITPRFEMRWLGVFLPMSTNHYGQFRMGTAVRLGPLVVGTNDLTFLFSSTKEVYGADFYANLSVPIFRKGKPRDKDKDEVSNRKDKCKDVAGPCETGGCPEKDTDKDGVIDRLDSCVLIPGLKEFNGCPDRDGDKVVDSKDQCPDVPGDSTLAGCPDKDGDRITDTADKCPELAGIIEFQGCPDTDKDGIPDSEDACPTEVGGKPTKGCPDKDFDGTADKLDKCPDVPGPVDNNGCPYLDTDKDGVLDKDDDCPKVAGPIENKGCPKQEVKVVVKEVPKEITPVEQKVLDLVFDNLEFQTGKDIIMASSYPSLNKLVEILKKRGKFKLTVSGHTDNKGSAALNNALSLKRANAVKRFLTSKALNSSMIITEGNGSNFPIADNATEEGRQKNRRVEFKLE